MTGLKVNSIFFKGYIFLLICVVVFCAGTAQAAMRRQAKFNAPKIPGLRYAYCDDMPKNGERRRRKNESLSEVEKSIGKMSNGYKTGTWTFLDKDGNLLAKGNCSPKPALKVTTENGKWEYRTKARQRVELDWSYGEQKGLWSLYDDQNKLKWQFRLFGGSKPKELIFADENYLKQNNLSDQIPERESID